MNKFSPENYKNCNRTEGISRSNSETRHDSTPAASSEPSPRNDAAFVEQMQICDGDRDAYNTIFGGGHSEFAAMEF